MNLLLDTHALLWWLTNSPRLGRKTRARISDTCAIIYVSAASAWEIAIKVSNGRLRIREPLINDLVGAVSREGFEVIAITMDHAIAMYGLAHHHTDPFDRILIAQAQFEGLTIVTADDAFEAYKVPIVDATE